LINTAKWNYDYSTAHVLCEIPTILKYPIKDKTTIIEEQINYIDKYSFLLLKCLRNDNTLNFKFEMELTNPNDEHLSLQEIPLINIYLVLSIFYILLFFLWSIDLVKYFFSHNGIQRLITISLFLKLTQTISFFVFYMFLSKIGFFYLKKGDFPLYVYIIKELLSVFSDTFFLGILLLTSLGWSITRRNINMREKQLFWVSFFLYTLFRILYSFCFEPSLCNFY
jgi:hypothetical protein